MRDYSKMTKAELLEALQRLQSTRKKQSSKEALENVVEELHIHQVELEMQNQELREAHGELEAARDRYQSLFDFAPVSYFTFDPKGVIVDMNLAAQALLGHDRNECIGRPFIHFVAPGHVREFLSHLRQSLQAREQLITEIPLSGQQGEIIVQMLSLAMPLVAEKDHFCRSAMIDVTERREIERQLQESEERYRRLFYPISDAVLLVDHSTEAIIDNNAAAITLYGYPARQLIGMKLSNLAVDQEKARALLQNPTRTTTALSQRREDGSTFPAEISVYQFIHRGLVVAGITVRDLSGQRRTEESHRREEEQFHAAVRNMPAFFAVYDQNCRYRFVNATAEIWLDRTAESLRGKSDEEVIPETVRKCYFPKVVRALETKSVQTAICIFQTHDGPVEAFMRFTPILDEGGRISQVLAVGMETGK